MGRCRIGCWPMSSEQKAADGRGRPRRPSSPTLFASLLSRCRRQRDHGSAPALPAAHSRARSIRFERSPRPLSVGRRRFVFFRARIASVGRRFDTRAPTHSVPMVLEDLRPNAVVRGVLPDANVTVVAVQWFGSQAVEVTYKDPAGRVGNVLLYRSQEAELELVEEGRPWSFDADGALFRLVSEAHRIR